MKYLFLFLLIFCVCCSAWEIDLISRVSTNIEVFNNSVIFACENGELYSLNLNDGELNWKSSTTASLPNELIIFDNLIIFSSENNAYFYNLNGNLKDMYSFSSFIYGIDSDENKIYFSTFDGIHAISKERVEEWFFTTSCEKTKPIVDEYQIYFNCPDRVYSINKEGKKTWDTIVRTPIAVEKGNLRYFFSTTDNKLKTLDINEGKERWDYTAGGWITEIKSSENEVFFISNDYYVYSLNADSGEHIWKTFVGDMTQFELNENIVLVGTKKYEIYGLNRKTGEKEFVIYTSDWPQKITIFENRVLYGTLDRKIGSEYIDHVCVFESPNERQIIGSTEFKIKGTVYSLDNSVNRIDITVLENPNIFSTAQGIRNWTAYLDLYNLQDGLITLECILYPYSDREPIKRRLIKTPTSSLIEEMEIKYPSSIGVQQNFQIHALNKHNRTINDLKAIYNGKEFLAERGYITMFFDSSGIKTLNLERKGYKSQTIQIRAGAQESSNNTLFYLIGIIILIILIVFLVKKIRK